jgi:aryl-alcohol dehydrogenase-like predicted oxidoreductase
MQTRKLGYSDLHLTTVGLGTWAIGGEWQWGWGPQDDAESIAAIQRAIDLGINWIDTAPAYGVGHSEEIVGRAIAGRRDQVTIATKCGMVWDEVIDLYQIHWPNPDEDIEEAWAAIADMIGEGKIRYAGASNFSVAQLKRVQAIHPVASLQPPYSMLRRHVEQELLPYCAANDIGVVAYSPMQAGLMTGKFSKARLSSLPDGDWRKQNTFFIEPQLSANLALVEKLRPIAERNGKTLAQLAIAWVLRRPEMTAAIVGARRASQIEETAPAGDWILSQEDIAEIDTLLKERDKVLA